MKTIELNQMEIIQGGGDFISGLCVGIGAGSIAYGVAVATNFWNPIGWVGAAFIVADVACLGYAASNL